jgi:hypothetical protein
MSDDFEWDDPAQGLKWEAAREPYRRWHGADQSQVGRTEGAIIEGALSLVAAELPRAPGTTDEQHLYDAFVELLRRHEVRRALCDGPI